MCTRSWVRPTSSAISDSRAFASDSGTIVIDQDYSPRASNSRTHGGRVWCSAGSRSTPGTHPRAALAARFWPEVVDVKAGASLRNALWAPRRAVGPRL
jgi:hypothetical protein